MFRITFPALLIMACASPPPVDAVPPQGPTLAAPTPNDLDQEILLGAARNAMHRNAVDEAIDRYERFLLAAPDNDEARSEYAGALFRSGRVGEAAGQYESLVRKHPTDPELTRILIDALLNLGDHPRAKAALVRALERWPDRADYALRLAQLQAADQEFDKARQVLGERVDLPSLPDDKMRFEAAELFLGLKEPNRARPLLDSRAPKMRGDPKFDAAMIRYALLSGDRELTREYAARFESSSSRDLPLRLELAESLYAGGYHALAGRMFHAILQADPRNHKALLGAARVALRNDDVASAESFLEQVPENQRDRVYRLAIAELDVIAGRYVHARRLLEQLVAENDDDTRARVALAGLERAELEFIKADARFRAMIADGLAERESKLALAESLAAQRRRRDSDAVCAAILRTSPDDVDAIVQLARNALETGRPGTASVLAADLLARGDLPSESVARLDTVDGEARLAMGDFAKATRAFESAMQRDGARNARAAYGLYRARRAIDDEGSAWPVLEEAVAAADFPIRFAVEISDLAMRRGDQVLARRVLELARARDASNLVVRSRLADWEASFGTPFRARQAAAMFRELLVDDPDNNKCRLGLARALGTARCHDESLAVYHRLRCEQPWNLLIAREQARLLRGVDGLPPAINQYDADIAQWSSGRLADPETEPTPPVEALCRERRLLALERDAKLAQTIRPITGRNLYRRLHAAEPYEQHILFELGQTHGALGETCPAIGCYNQLLDVNPNHRDASIALTGKATEFATRVTAGHYFQYERGRNGLTAIDRSRSFVGVTWPNPANESFLSLEYARLSLAPTAGDATPGDVLRVNCQQRVDCAMPLLHGSCVAKSYLFADVELQAIHHFVDPRPVFDLGVRYRTTDDVLWTFAGTMSNVLENSESLRQDIFRGGLRVNRSARPFVWWATELEYRFREYSDDNREHVFDWRNRIPLTPAPSEWSVLLDGRYWNFDEQSVFNPVPTDLTGMRHPYFTPDEFAQLDLGLEWKRWIWPDRFDGAQHWWVLFSYRARWDSQGEPYNLLRFGSEWDMRRCLTGSVVLEHTDSSVYNATGVYAQLTWLRL